MGSGKEAYWKCAFAFHALIASAPSRTKTHTLLNRLNGMLCRLESRGSTHLAPMTDVFPRNIPRSTIKYAAAGRVDKARVRKCVS